MQVLYCLNVAVAILTRHIMTFFCGEGYTFCLSSLDHKNIHNAWYFTHSFQFLALAHVLRPWKFQYFLKTLRSFRGWRMGATYMSRSVFFMCLVKHSYLSKRHRICGIGVDFKTWPAKYSMPALHESPLFIIQPALYWGHLHILMLFIFQFKWHSIANN